MKFLVVEDIESINNFIVACLHEYNSTADIDIALDGKTAEIMISNTTYDFIVLDLMLPYISGTELIKTLRKRSDCPVLILTALNNIDNKLKLFSLGADDYMVKPFDKREFIARVSAIIKRKIGGLSESYSIENMVINFHKRVVVIGENIIEELNGKLYELLEFLIKNPNLKFSSEHLFNRIWGYDSETVLSVITVYISKIRKLLKDAGGKKLSEHLVTTKNVGYSWKA